MKCPLLTMYAITFKRPEEYKDRDCLEEKCAWWLAQGNVCAVTSIAIDLSSIDTTIEILARR